MADSPYLQKRKQYWKKIADREFESMDAEAQAQWAELRPRE